MRAMDIVVDGSPIQPAIVFANKALNDAGLAPFFVLPEHKPEFEKVIASSMIIEMQPLINAIYQTVKREMTQIGK